MLTYIKTMLAMDDEGATALEYGILVALIAIILVGGVTAFGGRLNTFFQGLGTSFLS